MDELSDQEILLTIDSKTSNILIQIDELTQAVKNLAARVACLESILGVEPPAHQPTRPS